MLFGVPMIGFKKYISKKLIRTIPKSNIKPINIPERIVASQSPPEEFFEMETFHSKSRIIHVQPIHVLSLIHI